MQNQDPLKWNRCSHCLAKVANDGSTLNNEAKAQTLNGPSVLYDQQHFSLYLYPNTLCSRITLLINFQWDDKIRLHVQLTQSDCLWTTWTSRTTRWTLLAKKQHSHQTIWECQNYDGREWGLPWLVFRTITYLRSLDLDHQRVILPDRVHAECDPYDPQAGFIERSPGNLHAAPPDVLIEEWIV